MKQKFSSGLRNVLGSALSALRGALITGALILAPLGITIWVFVTLVGIADGLLQLLPDALQPETYLGFPIPGLGIVATVVLVALVGFGMRYYTGRRIVELYEAALGRVPILNALYQGLKQLFDTVLSKRGKHFRQVVLLEYPRKGIWCLAFLTNERDFLRAEGVESAPLVSVFLPTTPNPTSGFYLLVPSDDVRLVDISVEEAFKLIMSAGIVTPDTVRSARPMSASPEPPVRQIS